MSHVIIITSVFLKVHLLKLNTYSLERISPTATKQSGHVGLGNPDPVDRANP